MSAKFPRGGGGSKPILSHPSTCSWVCDQGQLNQAGSATKTSYNSEISHVVNSTIILSKALITNTDEAQLMVGNLI